MADAGILKRRAAGFKEASRILDLRHGTGVAPVAQSEVVNSVARSIISQRDVATQLAPAASMRAAVQNSYFGGGSK